MLDRSACNDRRRPSAASLVEPLIDRLANLRLDQLPQNRVVVVHGGVETEAGDHVLGLVAGGEEVERIALLQSLEGLTVLVVIRQSVDVVSQSSKRLSAALVPRVVGDSTAFSSRQAASWRR